MCRIVSHVSPEYQTDYIAFGSRRCKGQAILFTFFFQNIPLVIYENNLKHFYIPENKNLGLKSSVLIPEFKF